MPSSYTENQGITISPASLGDGSWRQSVVVDNTSDLYDDVQVGGTLTTGTSPTADTTIDIYAYGQWGASGEYTGGASGTDLAYTADGEEDELKLIGQITVDGTSDQGYEFLIGGIAKFFGGRMPPRWGIVIENNTVVALNATAGNHQINFQGVAD